MQRRPDEFVRFRKRKERVLGTIRVRGRKYLVLEKLSRRGAYRVFDFQAGPGGDYRVLHRLPYSDVCGQRIELLRRLTGATAHPHFPHIVDYAWQGRELFVVMSWICGMNLRGVLRTIRQGDAPRPSIWEVVRLFRGLAHGLSHYHRRANLVHGDISPANIILTAPTRRLVLIDFGSAWPVEFSATKELGDGITPRYAAPERTAKPLIEDFRADVFSLSVVAYELLTLEIPFEGAGGKAAARGAGLPPRLVAPSALLSRRQSQVPTRSLKRLDQHFRVALSLDPDGRFSTRREWLAAWDDLHNAVQGGSRSWRFDNWSLAGLHWIDKGLTRLRLGRRD